MPESTRFDPEFGTSIPLKISLLRHVFFIDKADFQTQEKNDLLFEHSFVSSFIPRQNISGVRRKCYDFSRQRLTYCGT